MALSAALFAALCAVFLAQDGAPPWLVALTLFAALLWASVAFFGHGARSRTE